MEETGTSLAHLRRRPAQHARASLLHLLPEKSASDLRRAGARVRSRGTGLAPRLAQRRESTCTADGVHFYDVLRPLRRLALRQS